jgi:hypothetical protein
MAANMYYQTQQSLQTLTSLTKVYIHQHISNIIIYGTNTTPDGTYALHTHTNIQITFGVLELHFGCHGKNCYQVGYSKSMLMQKNCEA